MDKKKQKDKFLKITFFALAVILSFSFGKEVIDFSNNLAGYPTTSAESGDIGPINAFDQLIGFLLILGFSFSAVHFIFHSRPKHSWYVMIAPSALLSLVDWRFFLIQLGYIFFGFFVGSIIRITSTKIGNALRGKPSSAPTRK